MNRRIRELARERNCPVSELGLPGISAQMKLKVPKDKAKRKIPGEVDHMEFDARVAKSEIKQEENAPARGAQRGGVTKRKVKFATDAKVGFTKHIKKVAKRRDRESDEGKLPALTDYHVHGDYEILSGDSAETRFLKATLRKCCPFPEEQQPWFVREPQRPLFHPKRKRDYPSDELPCEVYM